MQFVIAYRTGGTHHCQWRRVLDAWETRERANAEAAKMERMGYKANVYEAAKLDAMGLPVGWEAGAVDWEADHTFMSRMVTEHRKAA